MFVTIGLSPRRPLFGRVDHDHVVYSAEGEIAMQCIREAALHYGDAILLHRFVVMPDHVHIRFSWGAQGNALRTIGAFVGRIKQMIHYHIAGHAPSIWADGYHDIICTSERMNRCVDAYIANNPLKQWLMYRDRSLMHVREPFLLPPGCDEGCVWRAVGEEALLDASPLVAMRISRRIPAAKLPEVVAVCMRGVDHGYRYVSTFYSPGERALWEALAAHGTAPMVRLIPTFLELAYRPHGQEAPLFAARRLLVLSRMADPEAAPARGELLDLNEIAARLALGSPGGKAVYAQWNGSAVRYESRRAPVESLG